MSISQSLFDDVSLPYRCIPKNQPPPKKTTNPTPPLKKKTKQREINPKFLEQPLKLFDSLQEILNIILRWCKKNPVQ